MSVCSRQRRNRVSGSPILAGSGWVSVSDPVLRHLSWRCFYKVTPSRQINIRGFGSVPVTALMVYLFQLVPVTFTYLRAVCPCNVTTFLDLTSFRLLTGSGRVGSPGQKPSGRVGSRVKILTRFHLWFTITTANVKAAISSQKQWCSQALKSGWAQGVWGMEVPQQGPGAETR